MNAKARIKRAETAINTGREQLEIIWTEPDESGNFPPAAPGETVVFLKWDPSESATEGATLPAASE